MGGFIASYLDFMRHYMSDQVAKGKINNSY